MTCDKSARCKPRPPRELFTILCFLLFSPLRREFWKEGVKKHVALANVAATCHERLISCLTTEQQEEIRSLYATTIIIAAIQTMFTLRLMAKPTPCSSSV